MNFLLNFFIDHCCSKVEIKYTAKNQAFEKYKELYGSYTISNVISGRAYYKKDDGTYGIWWCDKLSKWYIAPDAYKGQCGGYIASREVDQCVHNVGYTWEYFDFNLSLSFKAGEGLLVSCLKSGKHISNG